ncbi:hypothetical protein SJZ58_004333 [Salmonella enterica]|nr:hypothetical protein [Salmonella enterica]EGG4134970.1 hypothetical protein [Salmonella enterica]ELX5323351.1 hypothetical protein [Salmonella enterica]
MKVKADQFRTRNFRRVLTDEGLQGMGGVEGVGSTTEKQQGRVAAAIFANCADLDNAQLDDLIEWIRLYRD